MTQSKIGPALVGNSHSNKHVSKWRTEQTPIDAGIVGAVARHGDLVVACLVAVNAYGDIVGSPASERPEPSIPEPGGTGGDDAFGGAGLNTTIGVVATNASLDKLGCSHMARGAHDGLARSVSPPHASVHGDAFVAIATGALDVPQDRVRWMAVRGVEDAIRSAASNGV